MRLKTKYIKARSNHDAFLTMVRACERGEFDLESIVHTWWKIYCKHVFFHKSVRSRYLNLKVQVRILQQKILEIDYKKNGLKFNIKKLKPYTFEGVL